MAKKSITIDQLAVMVKKGFDGVDKSFEKTASVEHVSNEVNGLKKWAEGRFDKIEKSYS